jgi:redox-sensitive bicupin YhaK (pirin superfamily)
MIAIRPAAARGTTRTDSLVSRHSFSFGDYYDPAHMGFGPLRVLNEEVLTPAAVGETQSHANMEILNWVVSGALHPADSDGGVLRAGDLQCLSAGRGVAHGESNDSTAEPLHFLQIWIQPDRVNAQPRTEQRSFPACESHAGLRLVASADGCEGSVPIRSDVRVFVARLGAGVHVVHPLCLGRRAWLQVTEGSVEINGVKLTAGDGAAALHENRLDLLGLADAEVLLFDLPER